MSESHPQRSNDARLTLLVQFDPDGGFPPHVRLHLEALRPLSRKLVLISNSPMNAAALEQAETLCDRVLLRDNIGWDFAGWRDALSHYNMNDWDEVLLTNSSVVGPLYPLEPIFDEMGGRPCDFWGMVASRRHATHIQSYFIAFKSRVIRSSAWDDFWASVEDISDKDEVIRRYETHLTRHFSKQHFAFETYIPFARFPSSIRILRLRALGDRRVPFSINYFNRSVHDYERLIEMGMPYLKASLLWGKDTVRFSGLQKVTELTQGYFDFSKLDK
ncbi:rhamnan synthesis F family protein [Halovulum sp. GXIMD14794]